MSKKPTISLRKDEPSQARQSVRVPSNDNVVLYENGTVIRDCPSADERQRIKDALTTLAILLEKNTAYLPLFLKLEAELKANAEVQKTLERARRLRGNL
ncbi:hypothetical protein O4H61_19330 [Roseovarius aestuarii]|nr:hypothetical protein [Roseovarius aestuarii]